MRIEIQLRIVGDDNSVISEGEIVHFDKGDDRLEMIGLSFDEAKAALVGIQGGVVTAQAESFLARHRNCDLCGSLLLSKGLAAFMRQAGKRSDVFCPSSIFSCAGKGWP
ncbi:hypothetical protein GGE65_008209 [Skermanella aerolata]|uniref:hypothetical protein n=1 Tax=Skermanella aerolata TaxID=393310 RepID=UPI003D211FEA